MKSKNVIAKFDEKLVFEGRAIRILPSRDDIMRDVFNNINICHRYQNSQYKLKERNNRV